MECIPTFIKKIIMNYIAILLNVLIISCCMIFVNTSNICWNTKLVTQHIQKSYKVTFWKPVERHCGLFWLFTCIDEKKYYVTRYKDVAYNVTEKYKECCPGYEWIDDKNEHCKPKCTKQCVHGQCTETNTCICDLGYVPHNETVCIPTVCIPCCTGGTCTEPNVCQCNLNSTQPVNTINSLCNDGFKMNDSGICEPISIPACVNTECTVPDNCFCLPGVQTTETSNASTSTICLDDCIHEQNMTQVCENDDDCNSMQDFTNFWIGISMVLILSILIVISAIYVCNKRGICKYERPKPNVKVSDEYIVTNSIYGWHS